MGRGLLPGRRLLSSVVAEAVGSGGGGGGGWAASAAGRSAAKSLGTHEVTNQAEDEGDWNAYFGDATLREGVARAGAERFEGRLSSLGASVGSRAWRAVADAANRRAPEWRSHDERGRYVGRAVYDGSYDELMGLFLEGGAAALAWRDRGPGAHAARATALYLSYQLDPGPCCPVTMTFAAAPVLEQHAPRGVAEAWLPRVTALAYDARDAPVEAKRAATVGMSMTEKQGGSDVRANRTVATRVAGDEYVLTGHKWFTSAPNSDGFLALALDPDGGPGALSCFLVPRRLPGGDANDGFRPLRLKEKLGDWSNASSEVEYLNAWAVLVGEPGRGVRTILDMVHRGAGQGRERRWPTSNRSSLGRFPLVSADFWTSDHLSERSRSEGAVSETRARGTLTLKRR